MYDSTKPARILIVDDHPLVRDGLSLRISMQPEMKVCGQAESENEAMALAAETSPDLVLVDISLKQGSGLDLIARIKAQYPEMKMLVITGFDESLYGERALRAGALGYLNKQQSNERLLEAIGVVLAGNRYLSTTLAERLVAQAIVGRGSGRPTDRLSNRELEVFRLIGEGLKTGAIADRLHISPHTIDTHRENIKRKLGLKSAGELSRQAVQWVLDSRR